MLSHIYYVCIQQKTTMIKTVKTLPPLPRARTHKWVLLSAVTGIACVILTFHLFVFPGFLKNTSAGQGDLPSTPKESKINLLREDGKTLIRPLLLVVVGEESSRYSNLKGKLTATIHDWEQKNSVRAVSVYIKDLNDASWMSIDGDQAYLPGSLIKVPIMIYFLKQEEEHPGTLKTTMLFEKPKHYFPSQEYKGDSILPGREYKISELLRYMIVESDNNATNLLSRRIKPDQFRKLFTDLEIPPDEINDVNYEISPREYSKFFRVLYNATYLDPALSEYGLNLLSECRFKDGIAKKLPPGTIVAGKFGERGINEVMDFSESAIVYKGNNPYSLTIMTKGTSVEQQTELISELSEEVYRSFKPN